MKAVLKEITESEGRYVSSSTSSTPSSGRAPRRGRWTRGTCSSPCWPGASSAWWARPPSTSTGSTSRRTRRWSAASSPCSWRPPRWRRPSRSCGGSRSATRCTTGCGSATTPSLPPPASRTATSGGASSRTRPSTWSTRRGAACASRSTPFRRRSTRWSGASPSSRSSGNALKSETDRSATERREAIEAELAELQEKSTGMKAEWQAEKAAIWRLQQLKEQIDELRNEAERPPGRETCSGRRRCSTARSPGRRRRWRRPRRG
jgi:hypothetical protein